MFTVLITSHDENIRKLIKQEEPHIEEPNRYSSKFRGNTGLELVKKKKRQGHGTFGLAELKLNKPTEFLKKNTRIVAPRPVIEGPRCLKPVLRPPLPPRLVPNKTRDQEEHKNFRAVNVARVVKAVPREPRRKFVDTRRGDFHDLETSGLLPKYIYSKTLGRVPGYLLRRLSEEEEGQRGKEESQHQHQGPTARYITESERRSLLEGLKRNWEELQKVFQLLPIMTDTLPKKRRKAKLELELKQLEHDIHKIERHPFIYVCPEVERDDVPPPSPV